MSCRKFEKLMQERAEGELAPDEARALQAHVNECPACARTARELDAITTALGRIPSEEPPPALARAVAARVRAAARRQPSPPAPQWWPRPAPAALALATALIALAWLWLAGADAGSALALLPDSPTEALRAGEQAYQGALHAPAAISRTGATWWAQATYSLRDMARAAARQWPPGLLYGALGLLVLANGVLYLRRPVALRATEGW